jgi:hypothetical protein
LIVSGTVETWFEDADTDTEYHAVLVYGRYFPGDPGRVSGPPEHCYPPEPAEIDVEQLLIDGNPVDMCAPEYEGIYSELYDAALEQEAGSAQEYYEDADAAYEDWRDRQDEREADRWAAEAEGL